MVDFDTLAAGDRCFRFIKACAEFRKDAGVFPFLPKRDGLLHHFGRAASGACGDSGKAGFLSVGEISMSKG